MQTADIILFNNFNRKEVRIKALFNGGSQGSYVSKRVQNNLSPKILNKEKIKDNTCNKDSSKEEISDYERSVTRKLSVKTEKGNKSIKVFAFHL